MSTGFLNPDYNWIKAMSEGPHSQRTNALALSLSLDVAEKHNPLSHSWDIEPPPHIDYGLTHSLIKLSHHALTKHDLKRYDFLSTAREEYYKAHFRYQHAYRAVADAQAYEKILDVERDEIYAYGEQRESQWADSDRQKETNAQDLLRRLEEFKEEKRERNAVTLRLSQAKRVFVESDLGRLVYVCKHLHKQYKKQKVRSADDPTHLPTAVPKLPARFTLNIPTKQPAIAVQIQNPRTAQSSSRPTSSEEESPKAPETSDSDGCPTCAKDDTTEKRRASRAVAAASQLVVHASKSGSAKRTHSVMMGEPDTV